MERINQKSKKWGEQRIDFALKAKTPEDWSKWEEPKNNFAFEFGSCWNQTIEYKVKDFAAEVGFFIDVLGFDCNTISKEYAMIMGHNKECFFSLRPPKEGEKETPTDAITIEFMLKNIFTTVDVLKERGVEFVHEAKSEEEGSPLYHARFLTPNGLNVRIWAFMPDHNKLN